jgi:hypothetical protein
MTALGEPLLARSFTLLGADSSRSEGRYAQTDVSG